MVTLGKALAGGVPVGAFGVSEQMVRSAMPKVRGEAGDESGIGGTLSGNPLAAAAALRASPEHVITAGAYAQMIPLARRWAAGVRRTIDTYGLPWHVTQLGARAKYRFRANAPRNGSEALAAKDGELERYLHSYALNRGVLITPFHNMALMSPTTRASDVDLHTQVFESSMRELAG